MPAEEQKKYSFVESLDGAKLLTLFDRLFDDHFPDKIKEVLEKKKWKVSYEELLTIVKEGKPFTYWDNLFPNQTPIFKEQHNYIRDGISNKIMHFYPINREKFEKAKQTLLVVNQELDNLLQNMENGKFVFDDSFIRLMEEYEQQMNLNSDTYFADDSYDTWLADD